MPCARPTRAEAGSVAPGSSAESSNRSRPFNGRSRRLRSGTSPPQSAALVETKERSPSTSMASCVMPSSKRTSYSAIRPLVSRIPTASSSRKPRRETLTE